MVQEQDTAWYLQTSDAVLEAFSSSPEGLSGDEARRRLAEFGPNRLPDAAPIRPWMILQAQFDSLIVRLLMVAAAVSVWLGETVDAAAIMAIVVLNALIGFVQEVRAEKALAALKAMTAPQAKVRREGRVSAIVASDLVPGDVMILEAGDCVPADGRLFRAERVMAVEAVLTGESLPVLKHTDPLTQPDLPLGDRQNLLFMGTYVAAGTAEAVVTATGLRTEMGHVAHLIGEAAEERRTPLQKRLQQLGQVLVWGASGIVALIFLVGLGRQIPLFELFLTAVSLAVAAVPEGLPAVVTVALAVGVQRMAGRRALIRKLASVETLGATSVIATDKTGTLTLGQMTVREGVAAHERFQVTGEGYAPTGQWMTALPAGMVEQVARVWAASSNARLAEQEGRWEVVGDPTEGALLVMAAKAGIESDELENQWPRVKAFPFDSERQRMSIVRRTPQGGLMLFAKGAAEVVIARSDRWLTSAGVVPLTDADRRALAGHQHQMAARALRVLAAAYRPLDQLPADDTVEDDLILVGLVGMEDPPRPEAESSVAQCQAAGIRVVMITGDHPETARAIAAQIGLLKADTDVLSGRELDQLSDAAFKERVRAVGVYARVTAAHKLRIVRAWREQGAVVAMTGDGVNDAPAIQAADVGISMGLTGTDVTKEASDMVVADDNFASIVAAVAEGRGVADNIQKTLLYLLAGNVGELLLILLCLLAALPLPLMPVHLLWINLMTDGLPAIALATDPKDPDAMRRPPRSREEAMLNRGFWGWMLLAGLLTAGVSLGVYLWALDRFSYPTAMTMAFATLVYAELLKSFAMRHPGKRLWQVGVFSNLKLVAVVGVSCVLQPWLYASDAIHRVFRTVPLTGEQIGLLVLVASLPYFGLELAKPFRR